jgi:hypothetical protein
MSEGAQPSPESTPTGYRYRGGGWCACARCRCRGVFWPVMLILIGGIFLMDQFTRWDWGDLWPLILIAAGVLKLVETSASAEGHRG